MEALRDDNEEALDELVSVFWEPLVSYASDILQNMDDARDAPSSLLRPAERTLQGPLGPMKCSPEGSCSLQWSTLWKTCPRAAERCCSSPSSTGFPTGRLRKFSVSLPRLQPISFVLLFGPFGRRSAAYLPTRAPPWRVGPDRGLVLLVGERYRFSFTASRCSGHDPTHGPRRLKPTKEYSWATGNKWTSGSEPGIPSLSPPTPPAPPPRPRRPPGPPAGLP